MYLRSAHTQCPTKVGAIDAAALCPFNNRPTAMDEKRKNLLHFGYDVSVWYNFVKKIIKIVAVRCHILKLKCTKFDFGWGSAPEPAGEAYIAPKTPLAKFTGAYF